MVKLKVIAPLLLLILIACNLTDLTGVNISFTTTADTPTSTGTPVVVVITATPVAEVSTPTPVIANTVTPVAPSNTATPVTANTVTPNASSSTATPVGASDPVVEAENIRTIATRRVSNLLLYTQNVHTLLNEIRNGQIAQPGPLNKLNDLNNDLAELWLKIAGYGLGTDPYLDKIQISSNGFSKPDGASSYGIAGPYAFWGLPRLYERLLKISTPAKEVASKQAEFADWVKAYSNPLRYPHRDFYERAYADYRLGRNLESLQYTTDLEALDRWLSALESVLEKIPSYFAQ